MADNGKIDVDGLPARPAGNLDSIVGVDKATREAAQFPVTALPMSDGMLAALRQQDQAIEQIRAAQGNAMVPYETAASLPGSDPGDGKRLAWVWGDANPANNGAWAWDGGWEKSEDQATALEGRIQSLEAYPLSDRLARVEAFQPNLLSWEQVTFEQMPPIVSGGEVSEEVVDGVQMARRTSGTSGVARTYIRMDLGSPTTEARRFSAGLVMDMANAGTSGGGISLAFRDGSGSFISNVFSQQASADAIVHPTAIKWEGELAPVGTRYIDIDIDLRNTSGSLHREYRFHSPFVVEGSVAAFRMPKSPDERPLPDTVDDIEYLVFSQVLAAMGSGNLWGDPDFSDADNYDGALGEWSVVEVYGVPTLRITNASRTKKFEPAEFSAFPEVFSFSAHVALQGQSGNSRIVFQQFAGSSEIAAARRTVNFPARDVPTRRIFVVEGIQKHPDATRLQVFMDAGIRSGISDVLELANPSIVEGVRAGFAPLAQPAPLRVSYFPDPEFTGQGMDPGGFGTRITLDGVSVLHLSGGGTTPLRMYRVPLAGRGRNLRFLADVYSDAARGGEVALLFYAADGSELGTSTRLTFRNDAPDTWESFDQTTTVPEGAEHVGVRFVTWNAVGPTFSRHRNVLLLTEHSQAPIDRSRVISLPPEGSSAAGAATVYVDGDEGDDSASGTQSDPLQSVTAAIAKLGGNGNVVVREGDIAPFSLSGALQVSIAAEKDARVRIIGGQKLTGISKTAGQTKVYQAPLSTSPHIWVYQDGVPEGEITADERHPLQRGRSHRLPFTRIWSANSIAAVDAADRPSWFWEAGILYFSVASGTDALEATIYVPGAVHGVGGGGNGQLVELYGLESWYNVYGFNMTGTQYRMHSCRAFGNRSNGIVRDGALGEEVNCEAGGNGNDGAGTHNTLGMADARRSHALIVDQWCHDNYDDGCSEHERCQATYIGGLNEYNGDRGMATSYGSNVTVYSMVSRKNGQIPGNAGEGFGVVGPVNPGNDNGVSGSMTCIDCVSDGDNYAYYVSAGEAKLMVINSRSFNARTAAYHAGSNNTIEMIDCRDSGSAQVKTGGGTFLIRNTDLVT